MKVKDVAKTFGVTITELAEMCECSRNHLYNAIESKHPIDGHRFNAILDRLQKRSNDTYANDIMKAMDAKGQRDTIIQRLRG